MKTLKEEWLQVKGFERYLVSNTGRVISTLRNRTKELKPQQDIIGYLHYSLYPEDKRFGLYDNNRGPKPKLFKGHRLVAETFIPSGDTKLQLNHKDGNKHNNVVTNLEWCTAQENIQHSWDMGIRKNTHCLIARANRRPVLAIHTDGTERYFESRLHTSFAIGCSRPLISEILKSKRVVERGAAAGYTFVSISELPEGKVFEEVSNYDERVIEYNDKYFGKFRKNKRVI